MDEAFTAALADRYRIERELGRGGMATVFLARLAALTGDRAGAAQAYRHYQALRSDAEPSVRPSVDSVRAELAKLAGNH